MDLKLTALAVAAATALWTHAASAQNYVNRIHSQRTGPEKCLGIQENELNHPFMAKCANYPAEMWSMDLSGDKGAFRLRSKRTGEERCLGVAAADKSKVIVASCGGYKNQFFRMEPSRVAGWSLIHSDLTGPDRCLGIAEAGGAVDLNMRPCGGYPGQNWTIAP